MDQINYSNFRYAQNTWSLLYSTLKNLACGYPELLATIHGAKKYMAKIRAKVVLTVTFCDIRSNFTHCFCCSLFCNSRGCR